MISRRLNLITGKMLQELPEGEIEYIIQLLNAILRIGLFLSQWKVAQIIIIQKPG